MKFDEINEAMTQQKDGDLKIPDSMDQLAGSQLPIQTVRKRMVSEIISQLLIIVLFFSYPFMVNMHEQPQATYLILMFLTALMTVGYVLKMYGFVRQTSQLEYNSRDMIQRYIFDLKILLETYKTAIVAGSLLLPLALAALILGAEQIDLNLYNKLFMLRLSVGQLVLLVGSYIALAVIFYAVTVKWSDRLYGHQIVKLEAVLAAYKEEGEHQE